MTAALSDTSDPVIRILEHQACGKRGCTCAAALRRGRGLTHCIYHADPGPSMNVKAIDGKLLIKCFAGCSQDNLVDALREAGIWPDAPDKPFVAPPQLRITHYPYCNANGDLVAVHVRKDLGNGRKTMPWQLPNGQTSRNGDLKSSDLPLYGLPTILERDDKAVILVEGEKAADAVAAEGLVAATLAGGAGQIDFGLALEPLRGRVVLLWPDNDEPGRELMKRVAEHLTNIAAKVQWLNVPGLPAKGDAADYFSADRDIAELRTYIGDELVLLDSLPPPERRFKLLTAAELKNRPDPEWLIDGVVQRDTLALVVGAQETYKSFVAIDMAMSIGEGLPWQGHACKQGTTVYVSAEGGSGLGLRVQAWETFNGIESKSCFFLADQAPQFLDGRQGGDVEELLLSLADLDPPPVLIVVDTLARVMVGHDENSTQDMGMLIATADRLRQATGVTVVLVHHNNKLGGIRGNTSLTGAVHTIIDFSREPNSRHVMVKCGKQKDGDHFQTMALESRIIELGENEVTGQLRTSLVLKIRTDSLAVSAFSTERTPLKPSNLQAIHALISLETATYTDWHDVSGLPNTTFRRVRQELVDEGYVDHLSDGYYRPTASGRSQGPVRANLGPVAPVALGPNRGQKGPYVVEGPLALDPTDGPNAQGPDEVGPNSEVEEPWV